MPIIFSTTTPASPACQPPARIYFEAPDDALLARVTEKVAELVGRHLSYTFHDEAPGGVTPIILEDVGPSAQPVHASVKGAMWFTKKPVTIQAIQWTGDNLREVIAFTDGPPGPPDTRTTHAGMAWEAYTDLVARDGLKIYTLEGKMLASPGDWIIRGVKGEYYPCKDEIFRLTYEPVVAHES